MSDLADFIASQDAAATPPRETDAMRRVRDLCARAIENERERKRLEERLGSVKAAQVRLLRETLPDAMDSAGLSKTTFQAGAVAATNQPVSISLKAFYQANIAADWDQEKREAGFEALISVGAEDLIKTTVTVSFGTRDHVRALEFYDQQVQAGRNPVMKENVHNQTLTKWLRERSEKGLAASAELLEKIGGFVGRVVDVRVVEEEPR